MVKPYDDVIFNENERIRIFDNVSENDLIWHRDLRDREIDVLSGEEWMFQFEDELPFKLERGVKFNVKSMTYHRLIQGKDRLILKIIEQ